MSIVINGRDIGAAYRPYIVAELSCNHGGSLARAMALVEAASAAGADAVKLQTFTADTLTIDCDRADFIIRLGPWSGRKLYDLYAEAATPWGWHESLFSRARELGMTAFSTAFDLSAVEFLEKLNCPAYKIASFEIGELSLIGRAAQTGKPVIISTGMASHGEIADALRVASPHVLPLHCVSGYPTPPAQANLCRLSEWEGDVGLSDHGKSTAVVAAAVALGACFIEKHLMLPDESGPDAGFSLLPDEFAAMALAAREAWGATRFSTPQCEAPQRQLRRSLYAVADIPRGARLSPDNVRSIRPGYGLPPSEEGRVLGSVAVRDIARGEPIHRGMFA